VETTWAVPVSKTDVAPFGISCYIYYDSKKAEEQVSITKSKFVVDSHEAYNGCYLDRGKDKLSLPISFHAKEVDTEDEKEKKDNENGLCGIRVPVIDRERARNNFKW
jgi:hypothetical protein